MYPEIYKPSRFYNEQRWKKRYREDSFWCKYCGAVVCTEPATSGVLNRNHCPYCLHSRHVDHAQAGDRLSACKAIMQPIGLAVKPGRDKFKTTKHGELMLIHRCSVCAKITLNRLAADDLVERLLEIFNASLGLDASSQGQVAQSGIRMLRREDLWLVLRQLRGIAPG